MSNNNEVEASKEAKRLYESLKSESSSTSSKSVEHNEELKAYYDLINQKAPENHVTLQTPIRNKGRCSGR